VTDLRDFIAARLDEDEQIARNASSPVPVGADRETWSYDREGFAVRASHGRWNVATRRDDPADAREIHMTDSYGQHIARHDPARVLREVAAKRRVMERHSADPTYTPVDRWYCLGCGNDDMGPLSEIEDCPELRDLAAPYSDHPDYRQEWAA